MMAQLVAGLFSTVEEAQHVMEDLLREGFARETISLIANDTVLGYGKHLNQATAQANEDVKTGEGASFGAAVGALTGIFVGLGALPIPGIGPVIAAGPLLAALTGGTVGAAAGAATGGVVAALVNTGLPEQDAQVYAESIRRGSALLLVSVSEPQAQQALAIISRHHPIDIGQRADEWRKGGWTAFDTNAIPYTAEALLQDTQPKTTGKG